MRNFLRSVSILENNVPDDDALVAMMKRKAIRNALARGNFTIVYGAPAGSTPGIPGATGAAPAYPRTGPNPEIGPVPTRELGPADPIETTARVAS